MGLESSKGADFETIGVIAMNGFGAAERRPSKAWGGFRPGIALLWIFRQGTRVPGFGPEIPPAQRASSSNSQGHRPWKNCKQ